jgi:hypothetical protein
MERHDADRERVSRLLSKLEGNPIEQAEMAEVRYRRGGGEGLRGGCEGV